jgi:hypothetical protein
VSGGDWVGEDFGNWGGGGRTAPPSLRPVPDEYEDPYYEVYANGNGDGEPVTAWTPLELGPFLDGTYVEPEPTVGLVRHDGVRFLYPGREHSILGETESGKSWFAAGSCLDVMQLGGVALYIHFEEATPIGTVGRFRALGASDELLLARFKFVGPDTKATAHTIAALVGLEPRLVILDGVNEGMVLHGHKINDPDGAAHFRRLLIKPFTAVGATVLAADHVVKNRENQGRDAFGSVHKGNAIDGCRIMLENVHEFGRGMKGKSRVFVTKDRPGFLRSHGQRSNIPGKTYMGDLVVDDTQEKSPDLVMRLWPPQQDEPRDDTDAGGMELGDMVLGVLDEQPDGMLPSWRKLLAAMRAAGHEFTDKELQHAVDDLEFHGRLKFVDGPRNSKGFQSSSASEGDRV